METNLHLVDMNDPLMPVLYRQEGCCWRTLVAMQEYLSGETLPRKWLALLWEDSLRAKLVNGVGYVTDDNAVIAMASKYVGGPINPDIVRLKGDLTSATLYNELPSINGVMFAQRCITMKQATHFMLYTGTIQFLFNPKPDYAIAGEDTWFLYGVTNGL